MMLNQFANSPARQPLLNLQGFADPARTSPPRLLYNPHRSYPAYSLLVGACQDGRPLLLDLLSPYTGPVLVAGDHASGKTSLLQNICISASCLNGPAEVRSLVISSHSQEWRSLPGSQAYVVPSSDQRNVESILAEMSALYEQRREGDPGGQAVLLFIDELEDLLSLDFAAQVQLHHLLKSGPPARIWAFAACRPPAALNLHYWINLFHTRLIGRTASPAALKSLALHPGLEPQGSAGSHRFSYWDGSSWHSFWSVSTGQPG